MDRINPKLLIDFYRRMILIRRFEERTAEQYALGKIGGFCHLYIGQEAVEVGAIAALREDDLALSQHPDINASYVVSDRLRLYKAIHIAVAVGLDEGVIAPVIRDCQRKSLSQIAETTKELIQRAKNRKLLPEDYAGATFSISNLGMFDVESFSAILTPPQAAAIAVGSVREVPVIDNGGIKSGLRMKVTMSCDHRSIDGLQAARFLAGFKKILENPSELAAGKL